MYYTSTYVRYYAILLDAHLYVLVDTKVYEIYMYYQTTRVQITQTYIQPYIPYIYIHIQLIMEVLVLMIANTRKAIVQEANHHLITMLPVVPLETLVQNIITLTM